MGIMLSVVTLSVIILSVDMLSVHILNVDMLVDVLSSFMLSVLAPSKIPSHVGMPLRERRVKETDI